MIKHILKYGLFTACLALMLVNLGSCTDESSGGGAPEILYVRATSNPDSTFNIANAGQVIAIMGKNLQDVKKVYINDQSIPFNPLFNTASNIIVTIPVEKNGDKVFDLKYIFTEDGEVISIEESTIRVETDRGVATYAFTVLGGDPAISMIDAEEYPIPTGSKVTVTGYNFVNVRRVYFTNVDPSPTATNIITVPEEIIDVTTGWDVRSTRELDSRDRYIVRSTLTFDLPDLPRDDGGNYFGYLVIETGTKASRSFSTLPAPVVESISSDMPLPGTEVTIKGLYFIDIEEISINGGEIVILPEDMTELTRTTISFIMPEKQPTNPKRNPLSITGRAGVTTLDNFYPYQNVLFDLETKGGDQGWGPNALYRVADDIDPPLTSDGKFAQIKGNTVDWWGPMVYWKFAPWEGSENVQVVLPSYDIIPAQTTTDEVYLSYECYNMIPFSLATTGGAMIRYRLGTALSSGYDGAGFKYLDYEYMTGPANVVLPGVDGEPQLDKWYQVLIPLSKFSGLEGKTYKDFAEAGVVEFFLQIQHQNGPGGQVNVCFDNIRIVTRLMSKAD